MFPEGYHCLRNALYSWTSFSFSQRGSSGRLTASAVINPLELSRPAGSSTVLREVDTADRYVSGFQANSAILRMVWAPNFGVVITKSVSTPADFNVTIWESIVESVVSYVNSLTTSFAAFSPRPSFKPRT